MQQTDINIAALVPYKVFPAKMGGQKGIALFYEYLSKLLPLTIISTKNNEFPVKYNAGFIPALGNSKWRYINPFLYFKLKKILRNGKFTHVILEHPYYGWLGSLLKKTLPIKLVVHSHNIEALRFKSTGKWWWHILYRYEKYIHREADTSFFISDEDREYAIQHYKLDPNTCHTITYGFELNAPPAPARRTEARVKLQQLHGIGPEETVLLFNGTLHYKPNLDAVNNILEQINPLLLSKNGFKYKLIICGKGLPDEYDDLKKHSDKNIIYAGFVDDISLYFLGADVFLNPVMEGGGIKTKVVEALGYNMQVVTTASGAIGVPETITGGKMNVVKDNDWKAFTEYITSLDNSNSIPPAFFEHFYWGNIAGKVKNILSGN